MDRFESMKAFARVAETGSFSEAARQLRISKSVVTKRVVQLERLIDAQLFHRTTRSVRLTDAGSAYYGRVVPLLAEIEDMDSAIGGRKADARGDLRISSPTSFGVLHLGRALCDFQERHPRMNIEVILNDRVVHPVAEGFDIALQDAPAASSLLIERRIAPVRRVVCAAPGYLRRRGTPRHPRDLAGHDCIQYSFLQTGNVWVFDGPKGRAQVTVTPRFTTNSGQIMRNAALLGNGIALLPTLLIAPDLRVRRLVPVLGEWAPAPLWIAAVYPQSHRQTLKVRLLVEFLMKRFGPEPAWDRNLTALRRLASRR
jgi:DNA-binding transcriptional LysR family regulator